MHQTQVYNAHSGKYELYYIVLGSVYADTPGRCKIDECGSAASKFCYHWCVLQSVHVTGNPGDRTGYNYPAGYVQRTVIDSYTLSR